MDRRETRPDLEVEEAPREVDPLPREVVVEGTRPEEGPREVEVFPREDEAVEAGAEGAAEALAGADSCQELDSGIGVEARLGGDGV